MEYNNQEAAREILSALRGGDVEVVEPPPPTPDPKTTTEAKRREHEAHCDKYTEYLMNKPSSSLTNAEQAFLTKAIMQWSRDEGRR
jgi:hypothetical protein